jgi:Tfp pilus assembly protein PilN
MRPVNLIPAEERRGDHTDVRLGAFTYLLVGGLALLMLGIIAVAFTSKQVSDREAEKQELAVELEEETARAESLRSFSDFRTVQETRTATVASLAQSRFDWERVIKEFSLILPSDVWLTNMTGTVSPAVSVKNGAEVTIRDSIPGPALELVGCAPSEEAVAGFIAAVEDIDGVTRVGVQESKQPDSSETEESAAPTGAASAGADDCRTRDFILQFQIVVAFDAVPTPATATTAPSVPAPAGTADSGQVAGSAPPSNMNQQIDQSQQATGVVPGG